MSSTKTGKTKRSLPLRQAGVTVSDHLTRPSKLLFDEVLRQENIDAPADVGNVQADELTQDTPPTPARAQQPRKSRQSVRREAAKSQSNADGTILPVETDALTQPTPPTPPTVVADKTKFSVSIFEKSPFSASVDSIEGLPFPVTESPSVFTFVGKSRAIYEALFALTHGAHPASETVRIPKKQLMQLAVVGSERTFLKNINLLKSTGLIAVREFEGQHQGHEYRVFTFDEIGVRFDTDASISKTTPATPATPATAVTQGTPVTAIDESLRPSLGTPPTAPTPPTPRRAVDRDIPAETAKQPETMGTKPPPEPHRDWIETEIRSRIEALEKTVLDKTGRRLDRREWMELLELFDRAIDERTNSIDAGKKGD